MGQFEFTGILIVSVVALIGVMTPIIKLNATLEHLTSDTKCIEKRVDSYRGQLENHEKRITKLEIK